MYTLRFIKERRAILKEEKGTPLRSIIHITSVSSGYLTIDIHERYKGFALFLCKETATSEAIQHLLHGLPLAVDTARSIGLGQDYVDDEDLDTYAFTLVVHIWLIVCVRMQHNKVPPEETNFSLSRRRQKYTCRKND